MRRISTFFRRFHLGAALLGAALLLTAAVPVTAQEGGDAGAAAEDVAVLKTNHGDIVLRFFPDVAPAHVENFLALARQGVYDGVQFHRVIPGFMIQGGDPNTKNDTRADDGTGGAGAGVAAEFSKVPHRRGILSMARSQDPNSARSQFFIVVSDSAFLDGKYSVFGMVAEGMETADKIVALPRDQRDNPLPDNPAIIEKVVVEKRQLEPRPAWTRP
jgi:cyclophilin family peptidyl-prolyl cis-trans isomerase